MPASDDIQAKYDRALKHFEAFNDEMRAYFEAHINSPVTKLHVNLPTGKIYVKWEGLPPIPPRFSAIVGDCVYNLRSVLDHLICLIATMNGGDCERDKTEFPIFLDPSAFNARIKKGAEKGLPAPNSGLAKIARLPQSAQTAIEACQPYHRAKDPHLHALWMLHELSNEDKHRKLNLTVVGAESVDLRISLRGKFIGTIKGQGAIHDGAVIADLDFILKAANVTRQQLSEWITSGTDPDPVTMDASFGMKIAFSKTGPGKGYLVDRTLRGINDYIATQVVPGLIPFLPK